MRRAHGALVGAAALVTLALSGAALADVPTAHAGSASSSGSTSVTGTSGASGSAVSMLLPAAGDVFTGISGDDATQYEDETGKHPAVFGSFITWGHPFDWAFSDAVGTHARVMLHISTTMGAGARQMITPQGIADGSGDAYLLSLAAGIAKHGAPVYIRLLPEMNNATNPYSADSLDGSPRGAAYSHRMFKQAWRRVVTILRGGGVSAIDAKLATLDLPPVQGISSTASIPVSAIAFIWCPETAGTPNVASESAASYWPGKAYVDWVGTDFYSHFPNFAGLNHFYKEFRGKPFVFAEWAMWDTDNTRFVDDFFSFINSHKRVKMILYNEGYGPSSPLLLSKYPAAAGAIRGEVASGRYLGYAPEWQPAG
ncbi:MAG TPA: hypothetical protein VHM72_08485 [Solirubrobacteraceae bacterium]|nr:hypothetical protein [Solirubrobacteraceae bacterium]